MNVLRTYSTLPGFAPSRRSAANQNRKDHRKFHVTEGSGATYTRNIDLDGRITGIVVSGTSSVPASTTLTYTLDNNARPTAIAETGLTNKTFSYDSENRINNFNPAGTNTNYNYDSNSNRTQTRNSISTAYNYPTTSNMLSSLSVGSTTTVSYTYDASGNLTSDGTHSWSYDARGRLTSATVSSITTTYGVNALGQRVTKAGAGVPSGGTNEFVYDEQGRLIGEYGSTGTLIEETVYLGDMPVAVLTASATYQVDPDKLNAPHIITNQTGNQVWFWDHLAFGDNAPNQNPSGLGIFNYNLRFPGQYADAETNLNYNYMRDYNPTLGRYIQSDPMGLAAGVNTYGYVGGNPAWATDPWGLQGIPPEVYDFVDEEAPALVEELQTEVQELEEYLLSNPQNVVNAQRLNQQLQCEQASGGSAANGELTPQTINASMPIPGYGPGELNNPLIPSNYGKYTTPQFYTPSGPAQTHFYMDPTTKQVLYYPDYKSKF